MAYIGRQSIVGNFVKLDAITAVNGQAAYTMQNNSVNFTDYSTVNQFLVSLNGTIQAPTDSFTVSGSTLTFASNLSTGDVIDFIIVFGNSLSAGVPTDGTVSLAKLSATGTKDATTFLRGDNTFASAGSPSITDNGNANAITIESSERVQFTRARSNTLGDSALEIKPSDTVVGVGFRMENTNNDIVVEKSSPSGSEAEIFRIRSGGGIALGGTGDANTIDDYEEGTWEATVTCGGGTITLNSGNNLCNYTKIGRMVQLNGSLTVSSVSSPSGDLLINGKPFATSGGEGGFRATGAFCLYNPTNGTPPGLIAQIFEGYGPLRIESSGSADRSQADHVQASSELRFTINYVTP